MSAKKKRAATRATEAAGAAQPPAARPATAPTADAEASPAQSPLLRRALLAATWLYVAALWFLALDQTFQWGVFGPDAPPLP